VAVTAITGTTLENGAVNTLIDAQKFAPNVKLTHNSFVAGGLSASIRGLAFDDLEKSFEPTVGVSIDGIFLGNNSGADMDLFDVESIEILRGPQGTLFGRNTIGGVMNVRRARPTGEFGGKVMADFGRYDYQDYKGILNFPIVEGKLAGKIRLRKLDSDTFQYNVTRDEDVKGRDLKSASGSLLFTPSDNFDALLNYDYYDDKSYPPELVNTSASTALFCAILPAELGCATTSADLAKAHDYKQSFQPRPFITTIKGHNWTLNMNWDLGDFTLTSITGTQDFDELLDIENTGAPIEIVLAYRDQSYKQFSEELRIASNWDKPLNFVAGVLYFHNKYTVFQNLWVLGGLANDFTSTQKLDSYAAFGEATYDITDNLRLTAGLRYTYEEKDIYQDNRAVGYVFDGKKDWDDVNHRLGLDYHVTDDTMLYATWSTGFRSGGWNARAGSPVEIGPYEPEDIDNYEAGIRSELFDHRLRLNLTGFTMDYKNKQVPIVVNAGGAPATLVQNAASVDYNGFELEGIARPFDAEVNLRMALGYLDAKYNKYFEEDPVTGEPVNVAKLAEVLFAPKWTFSIGGDWTTAVGGGDLTTQVTWSYTDDAYGTGPIPPDPNKLDVIPSYDSLDLSFNYRYPLKDTSVFFVTVYGTDIFNEGGRIGRPYVVPGLWSWAGPEIRRNYGIQVGIEF